MMPDFFEGSGAMRLHFGGIFITTLLQICSRVMIKEFANQLSFGEVKGKSIVAPFLLKVISDPFFASPCVLMTLLHLLLVIFW